jgi:ligand-binding sensor domain-containing protein
MIKQFSILLILIFIGKTMKAQTPMMRHITDEQGLPSMSVYDILQDKKGFMWMATEKGLYRYDGIFFKHYHGKSLRGTALSYLQEDKYGRIWGLTFAGQLWHTEGDSLKPFKPFDKDYKGGIPLFILTNKDEIWVSSNENLLTCYTSNELKKDSAKYIYQGEKAPSLFTSILFNDSSIYSVRLDANFIKLKEWKDLYTVQSKKIDSKDNFSEKYKRMNLYSIRSNFILKYAEGKNIRTSINEFKHDTLISIFSSTIENLHINNILKEKTGDIWLATHDGIIKYDKNGNQLNHLLKGITVGNVIKDNEGSYWFCTPTNGVYVIPSLNMKTLNTNNQIKKLAHNKMSNIYMGADNGYVLTFNTLKDQFTNSTQIDNKEEFQGFNWLQGEYGGLFFTNLYYYSLGKSNEIRNYCNLKYGNLTFRAIKESALTRNNDFIYSASSNGALKWNKNDGTFNIFNKRRFSCVKFNPKTNEVWFGSAEGFLIANEKDSVREIKTRFSVSDFAISYDGKVWIATDRQGLVLMENDVIIRNWKEGDGLIGNRIQKIIPDDNNVFWLTTDGGIQRFDANNFSFRSITRANNLLGTTIYDMTVTDKDVWVATSKGVQYFPKNISLTPSVKPTLFIDGITINDKKVDSIQNTYTFSQNATNIQVNFTGLSYFSSDRFLYRYRIPQLDSTWISTEPTSNYARFQSLLNGKYTFEVQLITEDGRTSDVKSMAMRVRPIIWKQWWFYSLMTLGAIVMITIYYRRIIGRIKERNLFEKKAATSELDKTRAEEAFRRAQLSALKAQMNPHFLFNALNSIQSYIFSNEKNEANAYLGKFSELMRQTLDMSQNDTISLDEEIQMLELYLSLESMRLKNELVWTVKTAQNINRFNAQIPPLLIQPYIENGIKHGLSPKKKDRKISVYFYQNEDNYLICEVSDNGIGRAKALEYKILRQKQHTSFSTSATEQRLNLLNLGRNDKIMVEYEDLYDANGTPTGTKAIIRIAV